MELINKWNEFCESVGYYDNMVYLLTRYNVNELLKLSPWELLHSVGDIDMTHDYFSYNGFEMVTLSHDDFLEMLKDYPEFTI